MASGDWLGLDALVLRRSVVIAAGALLFGAGILELASWRVDRRPSRGRGGAALVVLGLSSTLVTGQGWLLHDAYQTAMLNPLAGTIPSLAALALLATAGRSRGRVGSHPEAFAAGWLGVSVVAFSALAAAHRVVGISLDPGPAQQAALALVVAGLWFWTVPSAVRTQDVAGLHAGVLGALGFVWLMRAAAVVEPAAWGLASALLLAMISIVALTSAMTDLTSAADAEHERVRAAETALAAATAALAGHDRQDRDLRHSSRNSMHALRLATQTLAEHGEVLDAESRVRLSRAVVQEVTHLDALLTRRTAPREGPSNQTCSAVRIPAQMVRS